MFLSIRFQTYFPHVDNVYSHRSTQKYKRKPFVSHYWDCRLKGRPPGTPKSDDPNKKKRKRTARQRDLCDVKIKITEYFPGATATDSDLGTTLEALSTDNTGTAAAFFANGGGHSRDAQPFGVLTPNPTFPAGHPGARGQKYYTIQRVNGNGGNGKTDGIGGGHRHTLEDSDRVKKNSVQRYMLKEAKEKKKSAVSSVLHCVIFFTFYFILFFFGLAATCPCPPANAAPSNSPGRRSNEDRDLRKIPQDLICSIFIRSKTKRRSIYVTTLSH